MRCDRFEGAFVHDAIARLLDKRLPDRVREVLPRVVEIIAFELKVPDWSGMGLPIAFELAMTLADPDQGDGLAAVEDEWWDPRTHDEL